MTFLVMAFLFAFGTPFLSTRIRSVSQWIYKGYKDEEGLCPYQAPEAQCFKSRSGSWGHSVILSFHHRDQLWDLGKERNYRSLRHAFLELIGKGAHLETKRPLQK